MKIGPGMAPRGEPVRAARVRLRRLDRRHRAALDWALDPNGDGDFSDHLDIINLSLGSDYGPVDDPENDIIDNLAKNGVLPVMSIGNGGDLTDIGGSPGNAVRCSGGGEHRGRRRDYDGLKVNAPAAVAGVYPGQVSVAYDWANKPPVTGDVVVHPRRQC